MKVERMEPLTNTEGELRMAELVRNLVGNLERDPDRDLGRNVEREVVTC